MNESLAAQATFKEKKKPAESAALWLAGYIVSQQSRFTDSDLTSAQIYQSC